MSSTADGWRRGVGILAGLVILLSAIGAAAVLDNGIDALEATTGTNVDAETRSAADAQKHAEEAKAQAAAAKAEAEAAKAQAEVARKHADAAKASASASEAAAATARPRAAANSCRCPCAQAACPTASPTPAAQATPAATTAPEEESEEHEQGQSTAADLLIPLIGLVFGFAALGVILVARSAPEPPPLPEHDLVPAFEHATTAQRLALEGAARFRDLENLKSKSPWTAADALRAQEVTSLFERVGIAATNVGRATALMSPTESQAATFNGMRAVEQARIAQAALQKAMRENAGFEAAYGGIEAAQRAANEAAESAAKAAKIAATPPAEPPTETKTSEETEPAADPGKKAPNG